MADRMKNGMIISIVVLTMGATFAVAGDAAQKVAGDANFHCLVLDDANKPVASAYVCAQIIATDQFAQKQICLTDADVRFALAVKDIQLL